MAKWLVALAAVTVGVASQDTNPCSGFDVNTGKGMCNGVNVSIGAVICASGFDAKTCKAAWQNGGQTETYYFKGTPTGLPIGTEIQSDCSTNDFPANGGVAMALTYQDAQGNPAGCYPAADVAGSTLAYTPGTNGGVASVTIDFNVHTDAGGTQRDGFIKITCVAGGPTSNFSYTTIGDTGHQSQYEIDTTADCSGATPAPVPPGPAPPVGPTGYWCVANTTCLYGPQPDPSFKGGTQAQCEAICTPKYVCKGGQCVVAEQGGSYADCKQVCV